MALTDDRPEISSRAAVDDPPPPHRPAPAPLLLLGRLLVAALVVAASVLSALGAAEGDRVRAVLPVAAVLALVLGALALTRFSAFVLILLAARSSLDLVKLSSGGAAERWQDPASLVSVALLLASAVWLLVQVGSGNRLRGSGLRTALLVFAAAAAISVVGSEHPSAGAVEALRILSIVMMFVVVEQLVTDRASAVRTLVAVYAGLALPLVYTTAALLLGGPAGELKGSYVRLAGTFDNSNSFARYLAILVVFGVALLPALSRRLQVAMYVALALSSTFLVLTLTRGAVAAAVVGVLVVVLVQRRWRMLVAVGLAVGLAFVAVPDLGQRFASLELTGDVAGQEGDNGLRWRLDYWEQVLPLAADSPVTGIGLGVTEISTDAEKKPHNDYLRAYVETGLLGGAAYCAVHLLLLRNGWLVLRRFARGTFEHAVGAGALGTAVCFAVGSAGANIVSNVATMWPFVALAAVAAAMLRHSYDP